MTAVKGTNGFLCIVERSWAAATDSPDFWNPKVRAPNCFNPSAARTFAPIFLMNDKSRQPHLMFFVAGEAAKSWGGNLLGSPVMAADDPEERATIFLVWAGKWSDGTLAPPIVE